MTLPTRCLIALVLATAACTATISAPDPSQGQGPTSDPGPDPSQGQGPTSDPGPDPGQGEEPVPGPDPGPGGSDAPGQDPAPTDPPQDPPANGVTATFTATYQGQGSDESTCSNLFDMAGAEPQAEGKYPVFVYMVGTTETFTNGVATAAAAAMAARGFVAATVQYDSGSFGGCKALSGKAKCIFDSTSPTSAVETLCARSKADCSKGVVVGGFSQGAVLATLAKNFDARVAAAWGMGDGVTYSIYNLTSCVGDGRRTLPSDRLRAIDGERDQFIGPTADDVRSQFRTLTGLTCGNTATSCLQQDGSGWYIVQNGQVGDGAADHCYMRQTGDCRGNQNALDNAWQTGSDPWGMTANLAWLAGFTER